MSEFDARAREWDMDKMHMNRSLAIAGELKKMIPLQPSMKALEYGAGTGILSFLLKDLFSDITLMDSSQEMIRVCTEKSEYHQTSHIHPIWLDLEKTAFDDKFDLIYNQMVMHHVVGVEGMLHKFYDLLNPGGYLAIADLYPEDGSFHGIDVKVHWGFDPEELSRMAKKAGFQTVEHKTCFEMQRESGKKYPLFLLVAQR